MEFVFYFILSLNIFLINFVTKWFKHETKCKRPCLSNRVTFKLWGGVVKKLIGTVLSKCDNHIYLYSNKCMKLILQFSIIIIYFNFCFGCHTQDFVMFKVVAICLKPPLLFAHELLMTLLTQFKVEIISMSCSGSWQMSQLCRTSWRLF